MPRLTRLQSSSGRSRPFTDALLTTFALVGGGGGVRTLEDTGLRCVTSGTLVWVETTALKSQYILSTGK